jgi:aspartyl-tRNA(Asn)/glutamyl-tRNA(Gln) amidotransferase subunit B
MRGKEDAHDYRYFPCPDLIPIEIDQEWIDRVKKELPELPDARKERFITDLGLPEYDAQILTGARELADYFEGALKVCPSAKKISNWIMTELLREIKGEVASFISSCNVSPKSLGELIDLQEKGKISGKIAKTVFQKMMETGKQPMVIVKEDNLVQVSDEKELLSLVEEIVAAHPTQADDFRRGKAKLMGFFVGQLMKKTQGKANPKLANDLFLQELAKK